MTTEVTQLEQTLATKLAEDLNSNSEIHIIGNEEPSPKNCLMMATFTLW